MKDQQEMETRHQKPHQQPNASEDTPEPGRNGHADSQPAPGTDPDHHNPNGNADHDKVVTGQTSRRRINSSYFLFFLLAAALVGCYAIIEPYIHIIIVAGIFAIIFHPVQNKVLKWVNGKENLAAFCSCLIITLVVVLPLIFILLAMIQQGIQSANAIYHWIEAGEYEKLMDHPYVTRVYVWIQGTLPDLRRFFPDLDIRNIELDKMALNTTKVIGKALLDQGGQLAGNMTALVGKFFLFLFTFFFFVRDQEKIIDWLLHLLPLQSSQEERILAKIKSVSKSAILGTLVTAVAQGVAGGLAFWVAGLPALFWGVMMTFASLIPLVGTALIWLPAAVYLILVGKWIMGIGMILWCVIVVGSIDNFVRPLFMKGSADMSTLLIFFSILGGINYFGLLGLLYGPLIFGLAMVLLYIYSVEFESFLTRQDHR